MSRQVHFLPEPELRSSHFSVCSTQHKLLANAIDQLKDAKRQSDNNNFRSKYITGKLFSMRCNLFQLHPSTYRNKSQYTSHIFWVNQVIFRFWIAYTNEYELSKTIMSLIIFRKLSDRSSYFRIYIYITNHCACGIRESDHQNLTSFTFSCFFFFLHNYHIMSSAIALLWIKKIHTDNLHHFLSPTYNPLLIDLYVQINMPISINYHFVYVISMIIVVMSKLHIVMIHKCGAETEKESNKYIFF